MSPMTDTRRIALSDWLTVFGRLVGATTEERTDSLAEIGDALASDFGPETFCRASAIAVARECLGFPTYGRVFQALRQWRREHVLTAAQALGAPAVPALSSPEADEDALWRDPKLVEQRLAKLENGPADRWRKAGAEVLRVAIERNAPDLLPRFAARLDALIAPRHEPEVEQVMVGAAQGAPARPARPAIALSLDARIAMTEDTLRRNPLNGAARMQLDALRRQRADREAGGAA